MIVASPGSCAPCRAQALAAWSGGELLEELAVGHKGEGHGGQDLRARWWE